MNSTRHFCSGERLETMRFWKKSVYWKNKKRNGPLRETDSERVLFPVRSLTASMTVEAALVIPIFLFFMMEILYLFEAVRLQSGIIAALHETGTELSEYAFYAQYGLEEQSLVPEGEFSGTLNSLAVSETFVRKNVSDFLGSEYLAHSCLENGAGGISYLGSSVLEEDGIVDLTADYRIRPFLPLFGLGSFQARSRYYGHAWTGYEIGEKDGSGTGEEKSEEMVFVTASGVVYHRSRSCTYLKPSVRSVDASLLDTVRSSDGSKYYACERCRPARSGTLVITKDGNRYHSSASCTAIQREVQEIPLSEAGKTRRACSKCGGS